MLQHSIGVVLLNVSRVKTFTLIVQSFVECEMYWNDAIELSGTTV